MFLRFSNGKKNDHFNKLTDLKIVLYLSQNW